MAVNGRGLGDGVIQDRLLDWGVPATLTRTKPFTEFSGILAKSAGSLSGAR